MVWKIINIDSPGSDNVYGGDDIKKIMRLFSGYDLKSDEITDEVNIATDTSFVSEKFRIKSPTTGFNYIFRGQDINADRVISLPLMTDDGEISLSATGAINDWGDYLQTFRHQKFKLMNPANTFGYIFNSSTIAANRNVTLPLLTADDTLVTLNATQTLTNKTLTSPTISSMIINTNENTIKHGTTNNTGDLMVNTGAKFDRFARGNANQVPIMNATGTGLTWIDSSALAGEGGGPTSSGDYQVPAVGNTITGVWYGTTTASGSGCWTDFLTNTSNVTPSLITDSTGRIGQRYDFGSDEDAGGFRTNAEYFTLQSDPELWVRYKAVSGVSDADWRITIGFIDNVNADLGTGDDTLAGLSCFTWYKEIQDTSYIGIGHNDGDSTGNKDSSVSLDMSDTGIHTVRVFGDSTNSRFGISLDGANAQYVNSEIPASTTRLGCVVHFENEDTTSRSFELYGAYFKCTVI